VLNSVSGILGAGQAATDIRMGAGKPDFSDATFLVHQRRLKCLSFVVNADQVNSLLDIGRNVVIFEYDV